MNTKLFFAAFLLLKVFLLPFNALSQGETNNWIMGVRDHWLNFLAGDPQSTHPAYMVLGGTSQYFSYLNNPYITPTDLAGKFWFFWGGDHSSVISNIKGNLLFYANGDLIFNRNFDKLFQADPGMRLVAMQSLFIPKPGNKNRYYYFTPTGSALPVSIRYTELDVNLNNGNGGVVGTPDILLTQPAANKITATYHYNGIDIWVITHEMGSNAFKAFLVSESGVSTVPVISNTGINYPYGGGGHPFDNSTGGEMKFSPDGKRLLVSANYFNKVEVYDFNNNTGELTISLSINIFSPLSVEYSPDGSIAYVGVYGYIDNLQPPSIQTPQVLRDTNAIYQIDLLAGNSFQILNSVYKVNPNNDLNYEWNRMQLASNGKIYALDGTGMGIVGNTLNVISYPNSLGSACNFVFDDFNNYCSTTGNLDCDDYRALPSFFPPFLDRNILFDHACYQDSVLICTLTNTNFDSIRWELNDPLLGLISIPNQDTIYHEFPGFGPYEIFLKRYRNSGTEDVVRKMLYLYPKAEYNFPSDTLLCPGDDLTLKISSDNASFTWTHDYSGDTIYSDSITISQSGKYWPVIQSFYQTCNDLDSIQVYYQQDNLNLGSDNFYLCSNPGFLLDASVNDSTALFNWNTGDTSATIWVNTDGIYSVSVQQGNCISQDTVALAFDDSLSIALPDSVVLCDGIGTWLSAGDFNASYFWSPTGETSMDIWIDSAGIYSVTVSNGCGSFIDTTEFIVPEVPVIDLGSDTSICEGTSLLISAFFPHSTYHWNTGSTNSFIETMQAGIYAATVSNICGSDSDTISLAIEYPNTVNLGSDTTVCLQDNFTLEIGIVQGNILWSTGESIQQITVPISGNYAVSVSNACGLVEDNILVTVLDVPEIVLPVDTHICIGNHIMLNVSNPQSTYAWSTGSSNASIVTNDPGVYSVTISNICGIASDSIEVVVDDSLYIELGADTTVCLETNFMLQSNQTANQYLWSTGESNHEIAVLQTGEYWLLASNACNTSSDTISVIVNENTFAFEVDTLSLDSSLVLHLDAPLNYQTYLWSTNETSQSIEITIPGEFWLMVTDSVGCTATDTIIILPYISISELSASSIHLYPNPTTGELNLDGLKGGEMVEIYDVLGKKLLSMHSKTSTLKLNLSIYSEGIYFLKVKSHGQVFTSRILKE